ncbi:hypothetical protein JZ751_028451 [Albula glossodonta]|uniref:Uncharacterized protein n=1 Tax=Albula glossodonta TaxID=121402 RepID=A0A8T2NB92_9TELE|nr:hypothetical protein JZ751_028451 [Albula glossodonta]
MADPAFLSDVGVPKPSNRILHYPKTTFTSVADTPENLRLKQQSKMQSQVLYKEEFEKNKGKGFSVVADTPEMQRIKKTQDQISNVRLWPVPQSAPSSPHPPSLQPSPPSLHLSTLPHLSLKLAPPPAVRDIACSNVTNADQPE